MIDEPLLEQTLGLAQAFLRTLPSRRVGAAADRESLYRALRRPLGDDGVDPRQVIAELARDVEPGLVASAGPRYFGFVIGGSLPAALAAEWLTAAWDQDAGSYVAGPAAAVVEDVAGEWLLDLFGLPSTAGVGFVTGGQMANFTGLAAGRHAVLEHAGWDVEEDGLVGAPEVHVLVGEEAHVTVLAALRMLGLGQRRVVRVAADGQGRMRPDELRRALESCDGPTIVCAQEGNVNTGAFDPLQEIVPLVRAHGGWLHVDGAFGLWAAASPTHRSHVAGLSLADSWATDAHKWLNVPYDSGIAIVADRAAHRASMALRATYLIAGGETERDSYDWVPEASRRARGFAVYAALRSLGRRGLADLVDRCCALARRMAAALAPVPGVRVLNEVVLNQVLVRFEPPAGGDGDALTKAVIARAQRDGVCWLGGTRWKGLEAMRISVSNWSTSEIDADRSVAAIVAAVRAES